jgi:cold shock CspA family protein
MESLTVGTLLLWHANRGYGIIQGPTSHRERYFLHISQVDELPDFQPKVGIKFSFTVAPPRKDGELPRAMSARVVVAPVVSEAL